MYETRWSAIETSAGVYNFATLDSIITFQRQNGATVMFGLYGTPVFYASATAHPTYGDNVTKGPWGLLAECANPTSLTALNNFVTAVINRYNKAGGAWYDANNATLGKGIQEWETWNEPRLTATGNGSIPVNATALVLGTEYRIDSTGTTTWTSFGAANNTTGTVFTANRNGTVGDGTGVAQKVSGTGFWWGTSAQLIDMCVTQYDTIKALDSSVLVTSPGFSQAQELLPYLQATNTGATKTGAQSCDVGNFHEYSLNPPTVYFNTGQWMIDIVAHQIQGLRPLKNSLATAGFSSLPLHITEWGIDPTSSGVDMSAWYAETPEFRYKWVMRCFMSIAAHGIKSVHPWHWGETGATGNSGNWQDDVDGVQKAYNDIATLLVGKTINSATYNTLGVVTLNLSDGSVISV